MKLLPNHLDLAQKLKTSADTWSSIRLISIILKTSLWTRMSISLLKGNPHIETWDFGRKQRELQLLPEWDWSSLSSSSACDVGSWTSNFLSILKALYPTSHSNRWGIQFDYLSHLLLSGGEVGRETLGSPPSGSVGMNLNSQVSVGTLPARHSTVSSSVLSCGSWQLCSTSTSRIVSGQRCSSASPPPPPVPASAAPTPPEYGKFYQFN